jgi:hypothetical protein
LPTYLVSESIEQAQQIMESAQEEPMKTDSLSERQNHQKEAKKDGNAGNSQTVPFLSIFPSHKFFDQMVSTS